MLQDNTYLRLQKKPIKIMELVLEYLQCKDMKEGIKKAKIHSADLAIRRET